MPNIPNDPIMLMSYLNTQLRDNYASLEELCKSMCLEQAEMPIVAASQLVKHKPEEKDFLMRWIDVFDYE